MTDNRTTLLPCPFCGGEASKRLFYKGTYRIHCNDCDAHSGHSCDTEAEAIAAWNTRAELGGGTCELKQASWDDRQCTWGCICSACDAHFEHETGIGYNFCPNCGKRVSA